MAMNECPKILTIDDESMLRQSIVAFLEDSGFEVVEGENGQDGLKVFEEEKPDLVLTDLQMPVMGGLEVLAEVTKISPDTPIIVVSGAGGMSEAIEALRLGAWDYITKPITDLAVLEHAVNKSLERARLIEENKRYREQLEYNLRLLREDQDAGKTVQQKLLPQEPKQFGAYTCASSVNPSLYLSGDFADYFQVNDDKAVVYLADVSGHGASSAFVTVLLKSLVAQALSKFRMEKETTLVDVAQMMAHLSNEIYSAKLGKYMTLCYGVIDLKTHEMTYGVGGHYPSPILLRKNGDISYLPGEGFPVGILPSASYKTATMNFEPGDKLILFSDGVMEIFMNDQNMEAQDAGLLELMKRTQADISVTTKALGISEEKEQPDDISMVVCERQR